MLRWLEIRAFGFRTPVLAALAVAAFVAVMASACGKPPEVVKAGPLGVVSLIPPNTGSQREGKGTEWKDWLFASMRDEYARPDELPANHAVPRQQALAALHSLMKSRDGLLWIGHATFLIRIGGLTVLTDPVFSERVSPVPGIGPKRYKPPGVEISDIASLDLIVISHNHYDHLDATSLSELGNRFPNATVLMPDGSESFATQAGFQKVRGARAGSQFRVGDVRIMAAPAYHISSRIGLDAHMTPCLSWSIRHIGGNSIYFGGDTAYGPIFKRVRQALGPHRVALVPIGAYEPPAEVAHVHATPEQAVQIARDLGARVAVGMHWGTFALSSEPPMEPAQRFRRAGGSFARVLRIGETMPLE